MQPRRNQLSTRLVMATCLWGAGGLFLSHTVAWANDVTEALSRSSQESQSAPPATVAPDNKISEAARPASSGRLEETSAPSLGHLIPAYSELIAEPDRLSVWSSRESSLAPRYADFFRGHRPSDSALLEQMPRDPLYNVPIIQSPKVENHLRYFHTRIRGHFEQWLSRLQHYRPLVESIFAEFNLPTDLVFLSLVESGFNPHAYSRARATGPWQFMKGTGKLYGLRVNQYVDERRDPIKSTVAAARYLRDLYDLFGTWPLAMAAYNAGEGKVMRALERSHADSFDEIARTRHLRRETKEYVPRFMAATIIAKNPEQYGFDQDDEPVPHQFEEVMVTRPLALREIARAAGLTLQELKRLNPELRREVTPPDVRHYLLKVPVGTSQAVDQAVQTLPAWRAPLFTPEKIDARPVKPGWYRVRSGDSLFTVAKRFRLSVQELKAQNRMTTNRIRPGDLLAIGSSLQ